MGLAGFDPMRRFLLKVYARGDCYEYRGGRDKDGYGMFKVAGKMLRAHRYAFEMSGGFIPDGLQLDHRCRHPWCVRPSHLEAVTCLTNIRRGESGKRERARTHCAKGHPYAGDNLYVSSGRRGCRTCSRASAIREYYKRKALGLPLNQKQRLALRAQQDAAPSKAV